jgi:TonB family protein
MSTRAVPVPERNPYGALELKQYINKSTVRGFLVTASLLLLFLIYHLISGATDAGEKAPPLAPIAKLDLISLDAPAEEVEAPPPPAPEQIVPSGPAARAGTPTPIPDAEIAPDLQEFADMDVLDRASAEGGDGVDMGTFADNIDWEGEGVQVETREEEPDPGDFIAVEKQPGMDIVELQKLVEYPKLAKEAGVEGRVIVKALIDKSGGVRKTLVEYTDNSLLNQAAIDAIKNYKNFTPAIQNKQPVMVWISIPIRFKLR